MTAVTAAGVSVAGSAATLAYTTTETGAFTLVIAVVVAAGLLTTGSWGPAVDSAAGEGTSGEAASDEAAAGGGRQASAAIN